MNSGTDIGDLVNEVNDIRANTVAQNSKTIYTNSSVKFLLWIYENKKNLLTDIFLEELDANASTPSETTKRFLNQSNEKPLHFDMISVADFMTWIVSLRTSSGERPGYSTYNSHRSAFFNLFRNYGETMDAHLSSELTHHFKGLKRLTIRNIGEGMARIKIGKDPLSFGLYKFLGKAFLTQHSREYIFAHHFKNWNPSI